MLLEGYYVNKYLRTSFSKWIGILERNTGSRVMDGAMGRFKRIIYLYTRKYPSTCIPTYLTVNNLFDR